MRIFQGLDRSQSREPLMGGETTQYRHKFYSLGIPIITGIGGVAGTVLSIVNIVSKDDVFGSNGVALTASVVLVGLSLGHICTKMGGQGAPSIESDKFYEEFYEKLERVHQNLQQVLVQDGSINSSGRDSNVPLEEEGLGRSVVREEMERLLKVIIKDVDGIREEKNILAGTSVVRNFDNSRLKKLVEEMQNVLRTTQPHSHEFLLEMQKCIGEMSEIVNCNPRVLSSASPSVSSNLGSQNCTPNRKSVVIIDAISPVSHEFFVE
jgi:hypothetical protein